MKPLLSLLLILLLPVSAEAETIRIHYSDDLSPIIDAARQSYLETEDPLSEDPLYGITEDGQIRILLCSRNTAVEARDLPPEYTWTFEGRDETDSLAEAIDDIALMMAAFDYADVPSSLTAEVFNRLEVRFSDYREEFFDDSEISYYTEGLENNLPVIFEDYGLAYPGISIEDSCGGGLDVLLTADPPGARIWMTTPIRANFCSFQKQKKQECQAWSEVTGQESISAVGNFILYAIWPDGREIESFRDIDTMADSDSPSVVLTPG